MVLTGATVITLIGVPEGAALAGAAVVAPPVVAAVVPVLLLLEHAANRTTLTVRTVEASRMGLNRAAARADENDLFIRINPPGSSGLLDPTTLSTTGC